MVLVDGGTYEEVLPIRWKRNVAVKAESLRNVTIRPAPGYEYETIFKVDSGFWFSGLTFAGHQADVANGLQGWAVGFDELADNRDIGAAEIGAYILKSPYFWNSTSYTAEDDGGLAGSVSTGDTGGGILCDGNACATNSPIRSMVLAAFTQVNLDGPGALVINDGYMQQVSFFALLCKYHVRCETGGQVNLSGGGTTNFGIYGLMADGYSPKPIYLATVKEPAFGGVYREQFVSFDVGADLATYAVPHELSVNDRAYVCCY